LLYQSRVKVIIKIVLKLIKIKLISIFKLAIVLGVLLNGIVSQMHSVILTVIKHIFKGSRSQIPFSAKVNFHILIYQNPYSDIKLSVVNQVWPFNIFLNDKTHVFGHLQRRTELLKIALQLTFSCYWSKKWLFK